MTIYGEHGIIELIQPHMAHSASLYDGSRNKIADFHEDGSIDGFVYQIQEVMECVRAGKYESDIVPQQCTLECAELFDLIEATRKMNHK